MSGRDGNSMISLVLTPILLQGIGMSREMETLTRVTTFKGNSKRRYAMSETSNENVLAMVKSYDQLANLYDKSVEQVEEIIRLSRSKLLAHRLEHRPRPHLDNKVLSRCFWLT
jgi:hypothetical protein